MFMDDLNKKKISSTPKKKKSCQPREGVIRLDATHIKFRSTTSCCTHTVLLLSHWNFVSLAKIILYSNFAIIVNQLFLQDIQNSESLTTNVSLTKSKNKLGVIGAYEEESGGVGFIHRDVLFEN